MKIKNYLFGNFAQIFFPIFFVLFFIASVVIFIRIAGVTFIVKINFLELATLYLYTLPTMIFFVIPLSFFIACSVALSRLSYDYELIVLFALGMNPLKIIKIFLPIALLISFTMLVISIVLTPLSESAYKSFLEERKNDININLQSGEFGQRLGDWLVHIQESKDKSNLYENIVMFSSDSKKGGLITAKQALLQNNEGIVEVILKDGTLYKNEDNIVEEVDFERFVIRNILGNFDEYNLGVYEFWNRAFYENKRQEKTQRDLSMFVLVSLMPLFSLFFIPLLGIKNPRYQRNHVVMQSIGMIGIFYGLIYLGATYTPFFAMVFIPIFWIVLGYLGYKKYIARFY